MTRSFNEGLATANAEIKDKVQLYSKKLVIAPLLSAKEFGTDPYAATGCTRVEEFSIAESSRAEWNWVNQSHNTRSLFHLLGESNSTCSVAIPSTGIKVLTKKFVMRQQQRVYWMRLK
jgi:hypothetical protein